MTNKVDIRAHKDGYPTEWRQVECGELGQFQHPIVTRHWGSARHWVFEIRTTGDFRMDIIGGEIIAEPTSG